MKHLKRFNENNTDVITEQLIRDCFAHTFDMLESNNYEIGDAYFDTEFTRSWASNDFSDSCEKGFDILIKHEFYTQSDVSDFEKYVELINQLLEDVKRFTELYTPKDIFFEDGGNTEIHIMIQP